MDFRSVRPHSGITHVHSRLALRDTFVLQLIGFACLLGSVLIETPPDGEPRARPVAAW